MPNNYSATRTIRMLKCGGLVVRARNVEINTPEEYVTFYSIECPTGMLISKILGKSVTYDILSGCYSLDPTETEWPPLYRIGFRRTYKPPLESFIRHVPCPRHQARVNVEWRQGKWMKYLEHNKEWKEA